MLRPILAPSRPAPVSSHAASPLSGLTAGQIAAKAFAHFSTVSSVRLGGVIDYLSPAITLDLTLTRRGCAGALGISNAGPSPWW